LELHELLDLVRQISWRFERERRPDNFVILRPVKTGR
jgi:hypothetical protein